MQHADPCCMCDENKLEKMMPIWVVKHVGLKDHTGSMNMMFSIKVI